MMKKVRRNEEKENSKNEQNQLGMLHLYNRFLVFIFFFSGELTKFNMFPKGETLHCLKVSNFVVCAVSLLYCINQSECRFAYNLCSSSKRRVIIITLSGIVAHFVG